MPKVANAKQFETMALNADAKEYNRRVVSEELIPLLDPFGWTVIEVVLPFHNEQAHHRCCCYVKLKNREDPVIVWLDVDSDYDDTLLDSDELLANVRAAQEEEDA